MRAVKAVLPVAGLGTRFLPATKAVPKEMLPVVDKPAIQYVVEEAARAGLEDILMITGRGKGAIENHFDRAPFLEDALERKGDGARLDAVRAATYLADVHFLRQGDPRGLGHAVLRARQHVGQEPFAVMLGDDLIDAQEHLLERMLDEQAARDATIVALMEVDPEHIHLYGIADAEPTADADVVRIHGLVEKPAREYAPSNLAVIGRYVLKPEIFDVLEKTAPGRGNEIQLTDALQVLASDEAVAGPVYGVVFRGLRYDTGDRLDYLKAVVRLACGREDLGPDFRRWLGEFTASLQ
jgi:UTP--glucose-1-phosphate uridylyltransferase